MGEEGTNTATLPGSKSTVLLERGMIRVEGKKGIPLPRAALATLAVPVLPPPQHRCLGAVCLKGNDGCLHSQIPYRPSRRAQKEERHCVPARFEIRHFCPCRTMFLGCSHIT